MKLARIICFIFGHKWQYLKRNAKVVDYDKWGHTYTYRVDATCKRNCGIGITTVHFTDGGGWS